LRKRRLKVAFPGTKSRKFGAPDEREDSIDDVLFAVKMAEFSNALQSITCDNLARKFAPANDGCFHRHFGTGQR
jgi:hypothetical protein